MTTTPLAPESFPQEPHNATPDVIGYYALAPAPRVSPENDDAPVERYQLGEITGVKVVPSEHFGLSPDQSPSVIYEVSVSDPYVEQYDAETREEVKSQEIAISEFARIRREAGMWDRKPGKAYDVDGNEFKKRAWGDPESTKIHFEQTLQNEGMRVWRKELVPSAKALAFLADPNLNTVVTSPKTGEKHEVDADSKKWWSLCTDAVAIRSRGTVMAEVVKEVVDLHAIENDGEPAPFNWLSIACGTALPTMKAAVESNIAPNLTLVDWDTSAMEEARALGAEIGFEGNIDQRQNDIFSPEAMTELRDELAEKGELPQVVDMMGIFEYTGDNLGINPAPFLRSGYDLVAPGGTLIFGQMRNDRPVQDFTMGVVGWPYVEQRSPVEMMKIITEAGIPAKDVRMYLPDDGVYMVVEVSKPAEAAALQAEAENALA